MPNTNEHMPEKCKYGKSCRFLETCKKNHVCEHFQSGACRFGEACRLFHHVASAPQQNPPTRSGQGPTGALVARVQAAITEHETMIRGLADDFARIGTELGSLVGIAAQKHRKENLEVQQKVQSHPSIFKRDIVNRAWALYQVVCMQESAAYIWIDFRILCFVCHHDVTLQPVKPGILKFKIHATEIRIAVHHRT